MLVRVVQLRDQTAGFDHITHLDIQGGQGTTGFETQAAFSRRHQGAGTAGAQYDVAGTGSGGLQGGFLGGGCSRLTLLGFDIIIRATADGCHQHDQCDPEGRTG